MKRMWDTGRREVARGGRRRPSTGEREETRGLEEEWGPPTGMGDRDRERGRAGRSSRAVARVRSIPGNGDKGDLSRAGDEGPGARRIRRGAGAGASGGRKGKPSTPGADPARRDPLRGRPAAGGARGPGERAGESFRARKAAGGKRRPALSRGALPRKGSTAAEARGRERVKGAAAGDSRRAVRILLVACMFASLAAMVWVYIFTGVLNVRRVEVEGNRRLSDDYLRAISGITQDTHLLKMDVAAVERAVMAEPYVKEVEVKRRFPDTVILQVTERVPVGYLVQNGRYHLVDGDGVVVESPDSPPEGIPVITGMEVPVLFPGARLEDPDYGGLAGLLEEVPEELREEAEEAGYTGEDGYFLLVAGTRVIFGPSVDVRHKGEIALAAIREMSPRYGGLTYVDVTYPDHPAILPR